MPLNYPELFIPSLISFFAVLYVVPWHLRIRNIATLSMSFWMLALNLVHIINRCAIIVGYNFGLPLSHLLLARQLEALTSLRSRSVLYGVSLKRRMQLVDLALCFFAPIVGVLVHLTQMDRRFWVAEGFGPLPSTYWDTWGVVWMAIIPIGIAVGALIYTVMALVNIYLRRAKMLSMVSADTQTSKEQFIRLYVLSIAELGTCLLRAFFNMNSYQAGPQPFNRANREEKHIDLKTNGHVPKSIINGMTKRTMYLQFYTVAACSIVFFFCFATGTETTRFYKRFMSRFLPFVKNPDRADMTHLTSKGTGSFGSGKPSQLSSQDTVSSGKEQKLDYDDGGYQLNYLSSPTTPSAAHYKDSPVSPIGKEDHAVRGRVDSESDPLNQITPVASRVESTGNRTDSIAESKFDDIEAQKYWDDVLSERVKTVRINSTGIDEHGVAMEKRKKDSYYN